MLGVIRLMHMAEDGKPYFPRCGDAFEKLVAIVQADRVKPFAAHRYGRVMQADHDVACARIGNLIVKPRQFGCVQVSAGVISDTAVNAGNQPIASLSGSAVVERWRRKRIAHQCAYVMIARYAIDGQLQRRQQFAEMFVSTGTVILDQVARDDDKVGAPVIVAIMIEHCTQRRIGDSAAQICPDIGE